MQSVFVIITKLIASHFFCKEVFQSSYPAVRKWVFSPFSLPEVSWNLAWNFGEIIRATFSRVGCARGNFTKNFTSKTVWKTENFMQISLCWGRALRFFVRILAAMVIYSENEEKCKCNPWVKDSSRSLLSSDKEARRREEKALHPTRQSNLIKLESVSALFGSSCHYTPNYFRTELFLPLTRKLQWN